MLFDIATSKPRLAMRNAPRTTIMGHADSTARANTPVAVEPRHITERTHSGLGCAMRGENGQGCEDDWDVCT